MEQLVGVWQIEGIGLDKSHLTKLLGWMSFDDGDLPVPSYGFSGT